MKRFVLLLFILAKKRITFVGKITLLGSLNFHDDIKELMFIGIIVIKFILSIFFLTSFEYHAIVILVP